MSVHSNDLKLPCPSPRYHYSLVYFYPNPVFSHSQWAPTVAHTPMNRIGKSSQLPALGGTLDMRPRGLIRVCNMYMQRQMSCSASGWWWWWWWWAVVGDVIEIWITRSGWWKVDDGTITSLHRGYFWNNSKKTWLGSLSMPSGVFCWYHRCFLGRGRVVDWLNRFASTLALSHIFLKETASAQGFLPRDFPGVEARGGIDNLNVWGFSDVARFVGARLSSPSSWGNKVCSVIALDGWLRLLEETTFQGF